MLNNDVIIFDHQLETVERENKFLLRVLGKDPSLFYDPPMDIVPDST